MEPVIVTPPSVEPVSLAEAKLHLRVDITDDDDLITALITAAREQAETISGRVFCTTVFDWTLDGWPPYCWPDSSYRLLSEIRPPGQPLISVDSITYLDVNSDQQTLDPSKYQVLTGTPGRIVPAYPTVWPIVRPWPGSVTIRYTAGYGATADDVPTAAKAAIKMLLGGLYRNREWQTPIGNNFGLVPKTVDSLLATLSPGVYE